jgi:hypothetical protein
MFDVARVWVVVKSGLLLVSLRITVVDYFFGTLNFLIFLLVVVVVLFLTVQLEWANIILWSRVFSVVLVEGDLF